MAYHWIWIVLHKLWTFYGDRNYEPFMFSQDKVITLLNIPMLLLLILFAQPHLRVSWCHGVTQNFTKIPVNEHLCAPEIWKKIFNLDLQKCYQFDLNSPYIVFTQNLGFYQPVLLNHWGRQCYHPLDAIPILPFPFQDHMRQDITIVYCLICPTKLLCRSAEVFLWLLLSSLCSFLTYNNFNLIIAHSSMGDYEI